MDCVVSKLPVKKNI